MSESTELPASWAHAQASDVFWALQNGLSKRRGELGEPRTVLRLADVEGGRLRQRASRQIRLTAAELASYRVSPDDLLFIRVNGSRLLVGTAIACDGATDAAYCDHFIRARVHRDLVAPRFVAAFASTRVARLHFEAGMVSTAGQHTINQGTLGSLRIPVPPLLEQHRIVAAIEQQLSRVEAGVAALTRVQKELARYRASVLKAACEGRLVPTEAQLARAEGRDYEPASALLARILAERRARWEAQSSKRAKKYAEPAPPDDAALPELPEGWVWVSLAQLAELKGGITKGQKRRGNEQVRSVPYLRVANVQRGWLDLNEVKTIEASEEEIDDLRLEVGDVLFNEGGDRDKLGRGWIWSGQISDCIHQNHVFRARLCGGTSSKLVSWHGNTFGKGWFETHGKQTTNLASINLTKLAMLPVPLPPLAEQHRIVAEVERRLSIADEVAASVESALARAAKLRQSVLKRAFAGKLVPQDPNDEPASALLARIRAERERAAEVKPKKKTRARA